MKKPMKQPVPPDVVARKYIASTSVADLAQRELAELAEVVLTAVGNTPAWAFFLRQERLGLVMRALEAAAYRTQHQKETP